MSKREMILKTAARLFSTQGFDATTTLQLAREAGVTEPLIYYYFSGKDELFTRLIENIFANYFALSMNSSRSQAHPLNRSAG